MNLLKPDHDIEGPVRVPMKAADAKAIDAYDKMPSRSFVRGKVNLCTTMSMSWARSLPVATSHKISTLRGQSDRVIFAHI